MSDFEKFKEELPSKDILQFYNELSFTGKKFSGTDHEHAVTVWNKSEIKTMKDYHDLYLKCDVLLLANVFEKFRNISLKKCGLCFIIVHQLQDVIPCFIKRKLNLNLFQIQTYFFFCEKGMRGIVSCISKRYSQANDKYLKSYERKQELKHVCYLDSNNLYGYAMSKFLLINEFKWTD